MCQGGGLCVKVVMVVCVGVMMVVCVGVVVLWVLM